VEVINRVFAPAEDEIAYARTVISAFDAAQARGDGSVAVGGQLVDLPIVARAQRLLRAVADAEGGN
jgi:citrate lyase subunit beta/citryl-CoA lyase